MKAEEAKGKWCPFVKMIIGPNDSQWQGRAYTNRLNIVANGDEGYCLAGKCMAWVWDNNLPLTEWEGHCGLVRQDED